MKIGTKSTPNNIYKPDRMFFIYFFLFITKIKINSTTYGVSIKSNRLLFYGNRSKLNQIKRRRDADISAVTV